jgi:hypothetical protein
VKLRWVGSGICRICNPATWLIAGKEDAAAIEAISTVLLIRLHSFKALASFKFPANFCIPFASDTSFPIYV